MMTDAPQNQTSPIKGNKASDIYVSESPWNELLSSADLTTPAGKSPED